MLASTGVLLAGNIIPLASTEALPASKIILPTSMEALLASRIIMLADNGAFSALNIALLEDLEAARNGNRKKTASIYAALASTGTYLACTKAKSIRGKRSRPGFSLLRH
jgi:hypothetical protein